MPYPFHPISFFSPSTKPNEGSKISLEYSIGGYQFGDTGIYAKKEIAEFIPVSKKSFLRSVFSITKRYIKNPETKQNNLSVNDTVGTKSGDYFSTTVFQDLLDDLNETKDNFNKEDLFPFLSPLTEKEILSVAKKHEVAHWFLDDENGKVDEFGKERMEKLKQLYMIDSFLIKRKPSLDHEMVVIDAWNNLEISFCEQNDTTKYRFQFYELLGQPFSKTVNRDFSRRKRFINLEVNNLLTKILPHNSLTTKAVGFDNLKEEYILWYIDKKMWDK